MKRKTKLPATTNKPWKEFVALHKTLSEAKVPDEKAVERFRELALANPYLWKSTTETSATIRHALIQKITNGLSKAQLLTEEDALKRDLGYKMATPIEQLLIDHILTTKIHLIHAENVFSAKLTETMSFAASNYWQNFYASAQRRYLRAVETLARVRRLARNGPLFQFNIANAGGKQMNIQGELFGAKAAPESRLTDVNSSQ